MPTLTRAEAADLFRRPADRHITVGNGQVAVRSVGTGPDVLFVHGWPELWYSWRHQMTHVKRRRGMSRSGRGRGVHVA